MSSPLRRGWGGESDDGKLPANLPYTQNLSRSEKGPFVWRDSLQANSAVTSSSMSGSTARRATSPLRRMAFCR